MMDSSSASSPPQPQQQGQQQPSSTTPSNHTATNSADHRKTSKRKRRTAAASRRWTNDATEQKPLLAADQKTVSIPLWELQQQQEPQGNQEAADDARAADPLAIPIRIRSPQQESSVPNRPLHTKPPPSSASVRHAPPSKPQPRPRRNPSRRRRNRPGGGPPLSSVAPPPSTARSDSLQFRVTDLPPLSWTILFACQHGLTLVGGLVLVPLTIVPLMGGTTQQAAHLIGTTYFCTGLNTLLQTTVLGTRLPIVQVTSLAYLPPTLSIIAHADLQAIRHPAERFDETLAVLSGALLVTGLVQTLLATSGAVVPLLRFVSPVTIACVTSTIGLGYYNVGFEQVATCPSMGLTLIVVAVVCSQVLRPTTTTNRVGPRRRHEVHSTSQSSQPQQHADDDPSALTSTTYGVGRSPFFSSLGTSLRELVSLIPLLLAMSVTWGLSALLTHLDVWEDTDDDKNLCRTTSDVNLDDMPWFQVPGIWSDRHGQWPGVRFKLYGTSVYVCLLVEPKWNKRAVDRWWFL